MTGETKIGLITGLSVIIVFAMILSHKGAGQKEITPPLRTPEVQPEYAAEDRPPAPAALPQPTAPSPAAQPIDQPVVAAAPTEPAPSFETEQASLPAPFDSTRFVPVGTPQAADQPPPVMTEALRRQIEGLPPLQQKPRQTGKPASRPPASGGPGRLQPPDQPERVYIAQANDNLTRIARKFLGSGSVANVSLIYELNRELLPDKDSLQVGQKLRLPRRPATSPPPSRPDAQAPSETRSYVVKPGDSYAAVARAELGSAKRWREIFALNEDRFPDPDLVPAGATIRLPNSTRKELRLASR